MAKRVGRLRRKAKNLLTKHYRSKGKTSITKYMQEFKMRDKALLKLEPADQSGMYFRRFHGKIAVITGKIGRNTYEVSIKDSGKSKKLVVNPVHLTKV